MARPPYPIPGPPPRWVPRTPTFNGAPQNLAPQWFIFGIPVPAIIGRSWVWFWATAYWLLVQDGVTIPE